jgi:phosphoglycerate dehydrogenase-like enzyme
MDVFEQEPLPADHPLLELPNVVLTPHIGYVSAENYSTMYQQCVENIVNFLAGTPSRILNSDVLNNDRLR